jgi:hypothetical protein
MNKIEGKLGKTDLFMGPQMEFAYSCNSGQSLWKVEGCGGCHPVVKVD